MSNSRIGRKYFAGQFEGTASVPVCVWPIADGYEIVGGLIYPEGNWRLSFPLYQGDDLFLSFARLGSSPSMNRIEHWVSRHGLLTGSNSGEQPTSEDSYLQDSTGKVVAKQDPMRVETFKLEAARACGLLELYAQLQSKDIDAIEARVTNLRTPIDERLRNCPEWSGLQGEALKLYESIGGKPGYQWNLWIATKVLAEELTKAASGVRLRATLRDSINGLSYLTPYPRRDQRFEPPYALSSAWYCPDLLSAIYLQFYLLATQHKPLRRCENPACGLPFPITRKNRRYCNSTCRSNARNYR